MVVSTISTTGMTVSVFEGILDHKNPVCLECNNRCYALYRGGRKERIDGTYVCKPCNVIYKIPSTPRCKFTETKN